MIALWMSLSLNRGKVVGYNSKNGWVKKNLLFYG